MNKIPQKKFATPFCSYLMGRSICSDLNDRERRVEFWHLRLSGQNKMHFRILTLGRRIPGKVCASNQGRERRRTKGEQGQASSTSIVTSPVEPCGGSQSAADLALPIFKSLLMVHSQPLFSLLSSFQCSF